MVVYSLAQPAYVKLNPTLEMTEVTLATSAKVDGVEVGCADVLLVGPDADNDDVLTGLAARYAVLLNKVIAFGPPQI